MAQSLDSRCMLTPSIENENFASTKHGAEVISGENTIWLLSNSVVELLSDRLCDFCAFHLFDDENGITIKLKNPHWINHIQMRLHSDRGEFFSYYIEASQDEKIWQTVIDYSRYDCYSSQYLYFDGIFAQYFRIVGVRNPRMSLNRFDLFSCKLFWKSNTSKVKNGVVWPKKNIISSSLITTVAVTLTYCSNVYTFWTFRGRKSYQYFLVGFSASSSFVINLGQPYWISNIKIRRKNDCEYNIETCLDEFNWETVGNYCQQRHSWQKFAFPERCVVYVKITLHRGSTIQPDDVLFTWKDFEIPSNT